MGPPVQKKTTTGDAATAAGEGWAVGVLTTISMISIFPQGLVAIGLALFGTIEEPGWFVALHLPPPWDIVVALGFVAFGVYVGWLALEINRRNEEVKKTAA